MQDLDRDALADLDVLGEVDLAHAALADQLVDAVAAVDDLAEDVGIDLVVGLRGLRGLRRRDRGRLRRGPARAAVLGLAAIVRVRIAVARAAPDRARLAHGDVAATGLGDDHRRRALDELAEL